VPRNQEVIRQWKVLHALESSRHGATIDGLAGELDVTTRTIRRDLAALQEAGFPLYDERDDEGHVHWRIDGQVLKGLETGFTLAEMCALYLSRNLLESVAGTPFQRDLTHAFERLEKMLSPRMRQFLDRLPSVLAAKPGPRVRGGDSSPAIVARLLEATLHFRVATMRYHSVSSGRVKDYELHPYRLAFAQGGLYLLAYVPEYDDARTSPLTEHCRRTPVGPTSPVFEYDGLRDGAERSCTIQVSRQDISDTLPPEGERGIEHLERSDGDKVSVQVWRWSSE